MVQCSLVLLISVAAFHDFILINLERVYISHLKIPKDTITYVRTQLAQETMNRAPAEETTEREMEVNWGGLWLSLVIGNTSLHWAWYDGLTFKAKWDTGHLTDAHLTGAATYH
jgi:hypothetical protein